MIDQDRVEIGDQQVSTTEDGGPEAEEQQTKSSKRRWIICRCALQPQRQDEESWCGRPVEDSETDDRPTGQHDELVATEQRCHQRGHRHRPGHRVVERLLRQLHQRSSNQSNNDRVDTGEEVLDGGQSSVST